MRFEIRVIRAVSHPTHVQRYRADPLDVGRLAGERGHHVQRAFRFRWHVGHAIANDGAFQAGTRGGDNLLPLVPERGTPDANRAFALRGKIRKLERRGVNDAENRVRSPMLVDLEQGNRHRPFGHVAYEIDGPINPADAPIALSRLAMLRTVMPEPVEPVKIGQAVLDERH